MGVWREITRYHNLGFAVLWLRPKSKLPMESGWTTGPRKTLEELKKSYKEGMNCGVRLGGASKIGKGYLACIDVDVKNPAIETELLEKVYDLIGFHKLPEVLSGRGNGSRHYYCLTREPFKMRTVFKKKNEGEIVIYSEGRQVVLPPSIHPDTGREYRWKVPVISAADFPLLNFGGVAPPEKSAALSPTIEDFKAVPVNLDMLVGFPPETREAIEKGTGVTDRSAYLIRASWALFSAGLNRNEVLSVLSNPKYFLGETCYEHARTQSRRQAVRWLERYIVKKVEVEQSAEIFRGVPLPEPIPSLEDEKRPWRKDLDRTEKKKVRSTLKNLDLILSNATKENVFVEDLFASRIQYGMHTPWGGKKDVYIDNIDLLLVKRWFADSEFNIEPNKDLVLEVTSILAHRKRIHPVRDWLLSLKWDGESRINTWLKDFCNGKGEEPYLSEVSRKFLLAMVKRVFEPGCQWDYVLILEGKQGKYKSSIARAIASDKWFMDNLPDLKDKDSMLNLQGKWLIELGELADVKRADYNLVKAYLVRRIDSVRPHYGRLKSDVPRQSVFIGTINEGQYLKDPTGNRRYWPVKVGLCDVKGFLKIREQLFAEAMHIYKTTEEILTLSPEANAQAEDAQDSRRVDDDSFEMREAFLAFRESEKSKNFNFSKFRIRQDLLLGADAPWGPWANKNYVTQMGAQVLSQLGYEKHKIEGQRYWRKIKPSRQGQSGAYPKGSAPPRSGAEGQTQKGMPRGVCPGKIHHENKTLQ